LDGLPLAIAQAGAYIQESGSSLTKYLLFYKQQWSELMESDHLNNGPLKDYPNRSVWTTWGISYKAIREKNEDTANLLLLWSFLDNKDLWHDLFALSYKRLPIIAQMLSRWIGTIANSEIQFTVAMRLLRSYSLVEEITGTTGYATHPVVHQWARHSQGRSFETELGHLAVIIVGYSVPKEPNSNYYALQRRLLPHAQVCLRHIVQAEASARFGVNQADIYIGRSEVDDAFPSALGGLADLYDHHGKCVEALELHNREFNGLQKFLERRHKIAPGLFNESGVFYEGDLTTPGIDEILEKILRWSEENLGPMHRLTLRSVAGLAVDYWKQGKLVDAEEMYKRAIRGQVEVLGTTHVLTLQTFNNLGIFYANQGKPAEAELMYNCALRGYRKNIGEEGIGEYTPALEVLYNMGNLHREHGNLAQAEQHYKRALRGYERAAGKEHVLKHRQARDVMRYLGMVYLEQGEIGKGTATLERAISGDSAVFGPSHAYGQVPVNCVESLRILGRKLKRLPILKNRLKKLQVFEKKLKEVRNLEKKLKELQIPEEDLKELQIPEEDEKELQTLEEDLKELRVLEKELKELQIIDKELRKSKEDHPFGRENDWEEDEEGSEKCREEEHIEEDHTASSNALKVEGKQRPKREAGSSLSPEQSPKKRAQTRLPTSIHQRQ
jgi:Tfp pilus assembly protein PilF